MTTEGFETGVTGWTPSGATFAQSGTQHHTGTKSGLLTVAGSPTEATATHSAPANAGAEYTVDGWLYSTPGHANCGFQLSWRDVDGNEIDADDNESTLAAATWTHVTAGPSVAPAGTVSVQYGPIIVGTPANGVAMFVDDVTLTGVAITVTEDSGWPPRIVVAVTGLTPGDDVTVYRVLAGARTIVRAAGDVIMTDTSLVRYDAEQPFALPLTYVVVVDSVDTATSAQITSMLPGGKVAMTDAITGLAAEVVIVSWPSKLTERSGTKFDVGTRTVFVSSPRGSAESTVTLLVESTSSSAQISALLDSATSGIIELRQPGGYDDVDGCYFVVSDNKTRLSERGSDPRRLWVLDLIDSDPWALSLLAFGSTYADMEAAYDGLTYADLESDFDTYLAIAVFDWPAA